MKKIKIFISSTYDDLSRYREVLIKHLHRLGQEIEVMEYWTATSKTPLENSLKKLEDSDILVFVISNVRYGKITHEEFKHYIELREKGINKIACCFLMAENHPMPAKFIKEYDLLYSFRKEVEDHVTVEYFNTEDDLASKVVTAIINHIPNISDGIADLKSIRMLLDNKNLSLSNGFLLNEYLYIDDKSLKFKNEDLEKHFYAMIMAYELSKCNVKFDDVISFDPVVYRYLIRFISVYDIDLHNCVCEKLRDFKKPHLTRLLLHLIGDLKIYHCLEEVCKTAMFYSNSINEHFRGWMVTDFRTSLVNTLSSIINSKNIHIVDRYKIEAKNQQRWKAYRIFEKGIKEAYKSNS